MDTYFCDDGQCEVAIEAASAEAAAEAYVAEGDWGSSTVTYWVTVSVHETCPECDGDADLAGCEHCEQGRVNESSFTIAIEPAEPPCSSDDGHDWRSPYAIVGGCESNPGVRGHGGGITFDEICVNCGCGRTTDTWATNPCSGEQGLVSVSYDTEDDRLEEYLAARDADAVAEHGDWTEAEALAEDLD